MIDYKKCVYAKRHWTDIITCDLLDRQCPKQYDDSYNCGDYEDSTLIEE
jgi:hypothetical protein